MVELEEITLVTGSSDNIRRVVKFLEWAADEMDRSGAGFAHRHLRDWWRDWNDKHVDVIVHTPPDESYAKYYDGRAAFAAGDLESARRLLNESIVLAAHFKTHELLGDVCLAMNEPQQANGHFAAAYALNPGSDSAATKYAGTLAALGRLPEARDLLMEVFARNATYGPARKLWEKLESPA